MPTSIGRCQTFSHKITVGMRRFCVPVLPGTNDQLILEGLQNYEKEVFIALRHAIIEPKPVVLDVGGNIGQYLLLLKSMWQEAEIHTFEPFPKLAEMLVATASMNNWHDVQVNPWVVGMNDERARLYFSDTTTDTASTVPGFQDSNLHSMEVISTTLDNYVNQVDIKRVSLLKIDVEGGELEVIKGAARLLETFRPIVVLELLWTQNPQHLARQQEVIARLHSAGYHFHLIHPDGALEHQVIPTPDPEYRKLNFLVTTSRM